MFNGTAANSTNPSNITVALANQTYVNSASVASGASLNSTVTSINQTMQNQQIQVATHNILHSLSSSLNRVYSKLEYWWNGAQPKISAKAKQKAAALKAYQQGIDLQRQTGFESKIYATVEKMLNAKVKLEEGIAELAKYLNSQPLETYKEDFRWIVSVLQQNFPEQGNSLESHMQHRTQISFALEELKEEWVEAKIEEAITKIVRYLDSDRSGDPVEAFDREVKAFKENFDRTKAKALENALVAKLKENTTVQKRGTQEIQEYTLSSKVTLNATWDRLSLCANKLRAVLFGASSTNQEVKILDFQVGVLNLNTSLSEAISAQFPPRLGSNDITSACGDQAIFHLTTSDYNSNNQTAPASIFYHAVIEGDRLALAQHSAQSNLIDISRKAPRTAHLGQYKSARPHAFSNDDFNFVELYLFDTNATGQFRTVSEQLWPFNGLISSGRASRENKYLQEILSFVDGSIKVLAKMPFGIQELSFNATLSLTDTRNTTNSSPETFDQISDIPLATRTPLADDTRFTTLIAQLVNGSTALYTYDIPTQTFSSAKILPDGSRAFVANATMNIAHCPEQPGTYVYVREVEGAFKYDVVNATMGSSSLIGGEQEYTDYNTSSSPQPGVGCFSNNKIVFSFLDNAKPCYMTLDLNPLVDAPISGPFSPPYAAPSSPPFSVPVSAPSAGVEIVVNVPPNLGTTPVPIDRNGIVVSNSTITLTVTDKNGFKIVFTNNGTDVPEGEYFPVTVFRDGTISWGRGTATEGTVPVFTGCDAEDRCSPSKPGTPLQVLFNSGLDWKAILGATLGALVVMGIAGTTFYCRVFKPQYDRKRRRDEELAAAARAASLDSSSSTEQSQPITWTPGNTDYQSTATTNYQHNESP